MSATTTTTTTTKKQTCSNFVCSPLSDPCCVCPVSLYDAVLHHPYCFYALLNFDCFPHHWPPLISGFLLGSCLLPPSFGPRTFFRGVCRLFFHRVVYLRLYDHRFVWSFPSPSL